MSSLRINLINCDERLLRIILDGGNETLSKELDVEVPNQWNEFSKAIFEFALKIIKEHPADAKWLLYLPIETKSKVLLGSCGYKGAPDKNGMVEIGYEVVKAHRNKGYATEITDLLVKLAFSDRKIKKIQAHTAVENKASVRVLEKSDFHFVKEYLDGDDGLVRQWMVEKIMTGDV